MWNFLVKRQKHYTSEDVHNAVVASTLLILERIKANVEKASLPVDVSKEKEENELIRDRHGFDDHSFKNW